MAQIIYTETLDPRDELDPATNEWVYNGLDCAVTLEVFHATRAQLDPTTEKVYNFSRDLQAPVLEMTLRGILVDKNELRSVLKKVRRQLALLSSQINRIISKGIGIDLNWRSEKQLKHLFYDIMQLPVKRKRNANGAFVPTVNRDALEQLEAYYYAEPIIKRILLLRDLDKQRQFLETELDDDGRMRSNWNIAGTNTGRFSSAESDFHTGTNNQNVDRNLRKVFVPDAGMKLCDIDLEQADARNVGAVCWQLFVEEYGEEFAGAYLDACESGDLHTQVCRLGWPNLPWSGTMEIDRPIADGNAYRDQSYRDLAKRLGHGTNYMGQANVQKATKMPMKDIMAFQTRYFKGFPVIELWHKWVAEQLKSPGYIVTLLGRRRSFWARPSEKSSLRAAVAYEPQSLTADQVNTGMLRLHRSGRVQLLNQTHDSVKFQYRADEEHEIIPLALKLMQVRINLLKGREFCVPVEAKIGFNAGDADKDMIENPYGLVKWIGPGEDKRKRPSRFSNSKRLMRELQRIPL